MHPSLIARTALLLLGMALPGIAGAADDDGAPDAESIPLAGEPVNCVSLPRIRRTDIVDDQTVLFYMLGSDIYVNRLPRRCPGLKNADTFSYKTSLSELCNTDVITVLRTLGAGLSRGPTCGLGMFRPITPEAVAALKEPAPEPEPGKAEPEIQPAED